MSNLKKQAEDLGIEVNGRWSDETLQKKIDEAKAAKAEADNAAAFGGKGDHDGDGKTGGAAPSQAAVAGAAVADDGTVLKTEDTPKATKAAGIDQKTRLIITAQELNIEVDDEWNEDRLRAEIQMALEGRADLQVKGAVPPKEYGKVDYDPATKGEKTVEYTLVADYWDENGNRIAAGTDRAFTDAEARRLGSGVLKPKSVLG